MISEPSMDDVRSLARGRAIWSTQAKAKRAGDLAIKHYDARLKPRWRAMQPHPLAGARTAADAAHVILDAFFRDQDIATSRLSTANWHRIIDMMVVGHGTKLLLLAEYASPRPAARD